ncbi:MAG TPA: helix-turn-helix domain-containing protein [Kofleriaceae bacterium]
MLGHRYANQDCSAARALELIGERWSLLILRDAMFRNSTRFSQFQDSLGIATNVLAKRLETFVEAGLMKRRRRGDPAERSDYTLTRKGLALKPVIIALTEWGDRWIARGPVVFRTEPSGERVTLELRSANQPNVAVESVVARPRGRAR